MELRDKHGLTEQEFLKNYRADKYPRPSMTADIVLLSPAKEGAGLPLRPLVLSSAPGRDPRAWTISEAYLAVTDRQSLPVQAGDDAADARWFRLSRAGTLPNVQLTLACGDIQLVAELRAEVYDAPCGRIYNISVINAGDIAFDHAAIVLRGLFEWEALQRRV